VPKYPRVFTTLGGFALQEEISCRGLGGEILKLFPQANYFTIVRLLVWVSIAVYLTALVALMWQVLFRRNRAERRVILALLIPLLPFSVSFAVLNSRPELFAASALVAFGIALTSRQPTPPSAVGPAPANHGRCRSGPGNYAPTNSVEPE
jgi:hypothetical protein